MRWNVLMACALVVQVGCSKASTQNETSPAAAAPAKSEARHSPGRGRNDPPGSEQSVRRAEEGVRLHRRPHRRARREPAEVGAPAEHLEQRRRHSRSRPRWSRGSSSSSDVRSRRCTTSASPSGAPRVTRWSTRNATKARLERLPSTGSTTRCRSLSPTPGPCRRSKAESSRNRPSRKCSSPAARTTRRDRSSPTGTRSCPSRLSPASFR